MEQLPREILQHIISCGPFESALALSLVNQQLHSICREPVTIIAIIKNGNGSSDFNAARWCDKLGLQRETDPVICSKWALADCKGISAFLDPKAFLITDTTWRWLVPCVITNRKSLQAV